MVSEGVDVIVIKLGSDFELESITIETVGLSPGSESVISGNA